MREIKFRAKLTDKWNTKKEGDWFYFTLKEMNQYLARLPLDWESICEFISLKDKNGKEIYEGDILRNVDYPKKFKLKEQIEKGWVNQVEFIICQDGEYGYTVAGFINGVGKDNKLTKEEVIGNIYENKEPSL